MKLSEVARIKLRGHHNSNTKPFMDDFESATQSNPHGRGRVYGTVSLDVSPFSGKIHVGDIVALGDGSGLHTGGGKALKMLTSLADKHNVILSGTAKAYSNREGHIQSSDRLLRWYKKFGFTSYGGSDKEGYGMTYKPKRKH